MEGVVRRQEILSCLENSERPINGTALAKKFNISRQIIVQDIAILRAENHPILSTNRGYLLQKTDFIHHRTFCVKHDWEKEMEAELNTIVDYGGQVKNTIVEHDIYGEISVEMYLKSRKDVEEFLEQFRATGSLPLTSLTGGIHFHTVTADSEEDLDRIEGALKKLGIYVDLTINDE